MKKIISLVLFILFVTSFQINAKLADPDQEINHINVNTGYVVIGGEAQSFSVSTTSDYNCCYFWLSGEPSGMTLSYSCNSGTIEWTPPVVAFPTPYTFYIHGEGCYTPPSQNGEPVMTICDQHFVTQVTVIVYPPK
jgi:hypothetical protein